MDGRPYHHGDLRAALLDAAEAELRARGPEGFSLRAVAKRAGVSHAAPAHHFGDMRGLLAALAAQGFERLLELAARRGDRAAPEPRAQLLAYGLAYVAFARRDPALFRLCFSSQRPNPNDPALRRSGEAAFMRLATLTAAVTGGPALGDADAMAPAYRAWAVVHGLADLLVSGRMTALAELPPEAQEAHLARIISDALPGADA